MPAPPTSLRGVADSIRAHRIVTGWIDPASCPATAQPIRVAVLRRGEEVGAGPVNRPRPDISRDPALPAGFMVTCAEELDDRDLAVGAVTVEARTADGARIALPLHGPARAEALDRLLAGWAPGASAQTAELRALLARGRPVGPELQALLERIAAEADAPATPGRMRAIMMAFDSLGADCLLGHMQRRFGAEPLGLLRFSGIAIDAVTRALNDRLRGVGSPEFTRLEPDATGEYFSRDTRYHMHAHTFVFAKDVEFDQFHARQCAKIAYLARGLMENLAAGDKIMVVHDLPRDIPDHRLRALLRAVRAYGACPLLYVRAARPSAAAGQVVRRKDGLLVGHVPVQQETGGPGPDELRDAWGAMCAKAHAMAFGASGSGQAPA